LPLPQAPFWMSLRQVLASVVLYVVPLGQARMEQLASSSASATQAETEAKPSLPQLDARLHSAVEAESQAATTVLVS